MNVRICHSFWSKPIELARWDVSAPRQTKNSLWFYSLSAVFARLVGAEIVLHTDRAGKHLLDCIPYNHIYLTLENHDYDPEFWASGKIIAQEAEPLGSIHIDGDVFIKSKHTINLDHFSRSDLIVQSRETAGGWYESAIDGVRAVLAQHDPDLFRLFDPDRWNAFNCGVVGFNSRKLKDAYIAGYKRFYELLMIDKPFRNAWCPDLAIEQAWLHRIASRHESCVYCLLRQNNNNEDAKRIGLTHLIGKAKYTMKIVEQVKSILKQLAPDLYETCAEREKSLGLITGVAG
jgi:hypothetical protein